jgi:hypothetical protein
MRAIVSDARHRWRRGAAVTALAAALVCLSPSISQALPAEDPNVLAAVERGERAPLAVLPAVAVAVVWLWCARAAAASAGHHVLAQPLVRGGDIGSRAAALDVGPTAPGDRP